MGRKIIGATVGTPMNPQLFGGGTEHTHSYNDLTDIPVGEATLLKETTVDCSKLGFEGCVEAIKAYEPNENDGLANANRAVMKQVVEELEREVSVDKEKQVKLDEEKSVKNEPADLSM